MYASVRHYTLGAGSIDSLMHRVDDEFQRPSVSPQSRPSVLPSGGHLFSPLVAIGSPHRLPIESP